MISRRTFLGLVASTPIAGARRPSAAGVPEPDDGIDLRSVPVRRTGKVEIAFKSPGPQPNGLQATKDGLWIIDQSAGSRASLVDFADGRVRRSFDTGSFPDFGWSGYTGINGSSFDQRPKTQDRYTLEFVRCIRMSTFAVIRFARASGPFGVV